MSSYTIIDMKGTDKELAPYMAMIYSDFMRTLRFGNDWYKLIDSDAYYAVYENIIDALLKKAGTVVKLALLSDDFDICLGWSLFDSTTLHYIYVKKDHRKQGMGKYLMPEHFDKVSHLTTIGQVIRKKKFPRVPFNPFT